LRIQADSGIIGPEKINNELSGRRLATAKRFQVGRFACLSLFTWERPEVRQAVMKQDKRNSKDGTKQSVFSWAKEHYERGIDAAFYASKKMRLPDLDNSNLRYAYTQAIEAVKNILLFNYRTKPSALKKDEISGLTVEIFDKYNTPQKLDHGLRWICRLER